MIILSNTSAELLSAVSIQVVTLSLKSIVIRYIIVSIILVSAHFAVPSLVVVLPLQIHRSFVCTCTLTRIRDHTSVLLKIVRMLLVTNPL